MLRLRISYALDTSTVLWVEQVHNKASTVKMMKMTLRGKKTGVFHKSDKGLKYKHTKLFPITLQTTFIINTFKYISVTV